jgi:DNA-binding NtrC family response regulator
MGQRKPKVLVVDDEKNVLNTIGICLESIDIEAVLCAKPQEVIHLLRKHSFDIAFVDLKMSPMDGIEVLEEIKKLSPGTTVIIMTAHGSIDTAVSAIKKGAYDYLQKPFDFEEIKLFTEKVLEYHRLVSEVNELRETIASIERRGEIITHNRLMIEQLDLAARVAESTISILIEGESGTGKELLAHYIHQRSDRSDKAFIKVNCAAIPEQLLESELFGHVRGAFTGALKDRQGRFELADGGTIFLDEIGDLPPQIQSKLLRVLQTKDFERVGDNKTVKVDVRVISATNRNLDEALREGSFREDLFYRLNGVRIKLPPLRERPEDINLLVQYFLKKRSKDIPIEISPKADKILNAYRWSGNVRELENVIERAALLATNGIIDVQHLPEEINAKSDNQALSLEEMEKVQIKKVLQMAKDYDEAARILGVDRKTLLNKRKKYGL